jgi:DNA-binding transcriptional ArsR family regulator
VVAVRLLSNTVVDSLRTPPSLDFTLGGAGQPAPSIEIDAGTGYELLASLCGWGSTEMRASLEIGSRWFDERRMAASAPLGAALDAFAGTGRMFAHLAGMFHAASAPRDALHFLGWLEAVDPAELWLDLLGHRAPTSTLPVPSDLLAAGPSDPAARRRLAGAFAAGSWTRGLAPVAATAPEEVKDRLCDLLRRWHDEVLDNHLGTTDAALSRDAARVRALAATLPLGRVVELAGGGVDARLRPGTTGFVLVPHVILRPWVVVSEHDHLTVILHPVPPESLASLGDEPSNELVALCRALAEEQRLRILRGLAAGALSLQQVADHVGVARSTAHHHLALLRDAGLVDVEKGRSGTYRLREDHVAASLAQLAAYLSRPPSPGSPPTRVGGQAERARGVASERPRAARTP